MKNKYKEAIRVLYEVYPDYESRKEASTSYVMFFQRLDKRFDKQVFLEALKDKENKT